MQNFMTIARSAQYFHGTTTPQWTEQWTGAITMDLIL